MDGITHRVGQNRPDIPWTEQHLDPVLVKSVHDFYEITPPPITCSPGKIPDKKVLFSRPAQKPITGWRRRSSPAHPTTEEEKYLITAWNYTGDYAIYNNSPYEEQKKRGFGFANPQNNFYSFYDGTSLVGFVNLSEEETKFSLESA